MWSGRSRNLSSIGPNAGVLSNVNPIGRPRSSKPNARERDDTQSKKGNTCKRDTIEEKTHHMELQMRERERERSLPDVEKQIAKVTCVTK
jgi:hypothetical protein